MACGTGKTFTSLEVAEQETAGQGLVLFLVPSIALLGQTLNEWCTFTKAPINAICVCSDAGASQGRQSDNDELKTVLHLSVHRCSMQGSKAAVDCFKPGGKGKLYI